MAEYPTVFSISVSHTTRSPREGETDGVEYHFTTREAMEAAIEAGEFIETAEFGKNLYGTSKKAVKVSGSGLSLARGITWRRCCPTGSDASRSVLVPHPGCHSVCVPALRRMLLPKAAFVCWTLSARAVRAFASPLISTHFTSSSGRRAWKSWWVPLPSQTAGQRILARAPPGLPSTQDRPLRSRAAGTLLACAPRGNSRFLVVSWTAQEKRLHARGTETPETLKARMEEAADAFEYGT